ncbi:MAG: DeoR/GlpR transcriptional regulator [Spirochaetales bacterium]|nr:DeoR/GlpR transcriptional regulator [Spirochaetales bacterium]
MLARERRNEILKTLRGNGGLIKMKEIISHYGVSHETARRDIEALQDKGYVKRIFGGAILNSKMMPLDFTIGSDTEERGMEEREAIGLVASTLINEGESVLLANGTTVLEVARHLKRFKHLTIITNSLPVINELIGTDFDIYVLGGKIDNNELNMSGYLGVQSLQNIYADKAFIGAGGVTLDHGISDYSIYDASLREEIVRHAGSVILVTHSEKFGNNAFSIGIPLNSVSTIVTDKGLSGEYIKGLSEQGVRVIIADKANLPE